MPSPADFLPARGKAKGLPLIFEIVRELTAEDIYSLSILSNEERTAPAPPLQKITATHHRIARLMAEGRSDVDIAAIVGRTPQHIRNLKVDPSLRDLVHIYENQITAADLEDGARIRHELVEVSELAVLEIRDRLENSPKGIATSELRQLAQLGLDRTVAPPKSAAPIQQAPVNVTFNIAGRGLTPPEPEEIKEIQGTLIENEE